MRGKALTPRDSWPPMRGRLSGKEDGVRPGGSCNRVRAGLQHVRSWPLWELPRWLIALIVVVTSGYLAAVGVGASTVHV